MKHHNHSLPFVKIRRVSDQQPDSLVAVKLVAFSLPLALAKVTLEGNIIGSSSTKRQTERLMGLQITSFLKSLSPGVCDKLAKRFVFLLKWGCNKDKIGVSVYL